MKVETMINGLAVEKLTETIDLLKDRPELGEFKFRTVNDWVDGTFNIAKNPSAENLLSSQMVPDAPDRKSPHEHLIDEPPVFWGEDRGANPVEYLLTGLSGCITTTFIAYAAAQGVKIDKLRTELEGDIDVRAFLGVTHDVRPGYKQIRVRFHVKSDAPRETIVNLMRLAEKRSPVSDSVRFGVPVEFTLA